MTPVADPPGRGGIAWARCSAERRGDMYVAGASFYHHLTENDRSELPEIIRACGGRGTRVVELAAGSGRITKALLAIGAEVIAVDNSPEMLRFLEETIDADPRLSRRRSNLSVETGLILNPPIRCWWVGWLVGGCRVGCLGLGLVCWGVLGSGFRGWVGLVALGVCWRVPGSFGWWGLAGGSGQVS